MRLVLDASVAIKWIMLDQIDEAHIDLALDIMAAVENQRAIMLQPPHWLAEILAVVARRTPARVTQACDLFRKLPYATRGSALIHRRAAELAVRLDHHLFDTLYHAVALEEGATLVTADGRYFAAARHIGSIEMLTSFELGETQSN